MSNITPIDRYRDRKDDESSEEAARQASMRRHPAMQARLRRENEKALREAQGEDDTEPRNDIARAALRRAMQQECESSRDDE